MTLCHFILLDLKICFLNQRPCVRGGAGGSLRGPFHHEAFDKRNKSFDQLFGNSWERMVHYVNSLIV